MRTAVTGANGFIGRHVVSRLSARGDEVTPIARPFVGHLLARLFRMADVVVHLAGVVSASTDREYAEGNVTATRLVAEAARDAGVHLVHISSLAAVGPAAPTAPAVESDTPAPVTAYGRSKLEGECVVKGTQDLRWTVLRPGVVYGFGDRALVPLFRMAKFGMMPLVGRPTAAYTFVHIDDMVDTIVAAVDRFRAGATLFVGHPQPVTPRTLVEQIRQTAGGAGPIVRIPRTALRIAAWGGDGYAAVTGRTAMINSRRFVELDSPGFVCRVDRLREELGVEARVDLAEGLRRSADWYLSQV